MTSLHYLNVGAGDCTLIQHESGRVTMVDICGGNVRPHRIGDLLAAAPSGALSGVRPGGLFGALGGALPPPAPQNSFLGAFSARSALRGALPPPPQDTVLGAFSARSALVAALRAPQEQPRGNFGMAEERQNPLNYLANLNITEIFRFISTHPDMDHLDGLEALFRQVSVANFWHTGVTRPEPEFGIGCPYKEVDWTRYRTVVEGRQQGTTVIQRVLDDGFFHFASRNADGTGGGDELYILAPDAALVRSAERDEDINEASYVLGMNTPAGRVIIPGDAHDQSWELVLRANRPWVQNCALLLAPHHGRDSGRDYEFLDVLSPKLTLMGCVPAEHMSGSWRTRGLSTMTNNQAGNIRVDFLPNFLSVWAENESFARARLGSEPTRDAFGMYYCGLWHTS